MSYGLHVGHLSVQGISVESRRGMNVEHMVKCMTAEYYGTWARHFGIIRSTNKQGCA